MCFSIILAFKLKVRLVLTTIIFAAGFVPRHYENRHMHTNSMSALNNRFLLVLSFFRIFYNFYTILTHIKKFFCDYAAKLVLCASKQNTQKFRDRGIA